MRDNNLSLAQGGQEAGKAGRRCTRSFGPENLYTVCRMASSTTPQETTAVVLQDMFARGSRCSERSAVGCLRELGTDAAFDIYIDDLLDCLHECATEDAVAWVSDRACRRRRCCREGNVLIPWSLGCKWRMAANTVKANHDHTPRLMVGFSSWDRALLDPGQGGHQPGTEYRYLGSGWRIRWDPAAWARCAQRMAGGRCWHVPVSDSSALPHAARPLFTQRSRYGGLGYS
jgi:hypothetical protein